MDLLFWLCLLFILYTYAGYPILIKILSLFGSMSIEKSIVDNELPYVTVLLTVRNEADNIQRKLANLTEQTYPLGKMEIVVISDGSEDGTDSLVRDWITNQDRREPPVYLIHYSDRQGKPHAVNKGVEQAKGSIIVLSDVRQRFSKDAVLQLTANFHDPSVGCVSGELLFKKDLKSEISEEMGAYWKYEKWIRKIESQIGSVVGVTGSIYAIRKSLFSEIPKQTLLDDVYEPMCVASKGYRVIFDDSAQAVDILSKNISQEWKRKVRTLAGNWQLISVAPQFFYPFSNPIWWKFWSHKIFRLLVPFLLVGMLVGGALQGGIFYQIVTLAQIFLYLIIGCAHFFPILRKLKLINLIYFFMTLNLAVIIGFYYWVTGKSHELWTPAYGKQEKKK